MYFRFSDKREALVTCKPWNWFTSTWRTHSKFIIWFQKYMHLKSLLLYESTGTHDTHGICHAIFNVCPIRIFVYMFYFQ